jgi:hypothetical protein
LHSLLISLSFIINTLASCRIGPNSVIDEEGMTSLTEANPSSCHDQGKHHAYPFIKAFALKHFNLC